jgi:hypothetical protein
MRRISVPVIVAATAIAGAAVVASSAPLMAQGGLSPGLSYRIGLSGGGGLPGVALVPGLELRHGGPVYLLLGADAYIYQAPRSPSVLPEPGPGELRDVSRAALSPPRMRGGVGWRRTGPAAVLAVETYVGQHGVVEGFHPLVGAGASMGRERWAVGLDGSLSRGTTYARSYSSFVEGMIDETPVGTTWVPRWEVSARHRVGPPPSDIGRPVLYGLAAGAAGGIAGSLVAAALADCSGQEGCIGAAITGFVVGETLVLPLGVHLAEGRHGSYLLGAATSVGVTAAAVGLLFVIGDSGAPAQGVSLLVPVAQLAATIALERRAARR